ncbi:hypothetical protein MAPG_11655 [Magnaporthiopsis poae ATCC 64411]|uniref:Uncharacterized protein n=1 Tax=Magnaporthiopsis poae (strain ATCC 64411 / 73-15) TaxID=644358 RepID=A0A0C4EFU7_MAGP6|nr:hypothetical protein MAPG_11655 [Magnaporthiopsis poae ATCC 64411]
MERGVNCRTETNLQESPSRPGRPKTSTMKATLAALLAAAVQHCIAADQTSTGRLWFPSTLGSNDLVYTFRPASVGVISGNPTSTLVLDVKDEQGPQYTATYVSRTAMRLTYDAENDGMRTVIWADCTSRDSSASCASTLVRAPPSAEIRTSDGGLQVIGNGGGSMSNSRGNGVVPVVDAMVTITSGTVPARTASPGGDGGGGGQSSSASSGSGSGVLGGGTAVQTGGAKPSGGARVLQVGVVLVGAAVLAGALALLL